MSYIAVRTIWIVPQRAWRGASRRSSIPNLPPAIATYFASEKSTDAETLTACFSPDALVHDDEHEHRGIDAIKVWRLDTQAKTPFTSRPLDLHEREGRFVVSAEVSGSFPNSPIVLEYTFTVVEGRIAELDIR